MMDKFKEWGLSDIHEQYFEPARAVGSTLIMECRRP